MKNDIFYLTKKKDDTLFLFSLIESGYWPPVVRKNTIRFTTNPEHILAV